MTMKPPQLPTDNLYKFMALSGITLVIASFLPHLHVYKITMRVIRLKGEIEALKTERKWQAADDEKLQKEIRSLTEQLEKLKEVTASEVMSAFDTKRTLSEVRQKKEAETDVTAKKLDELLAKRAKSREMLRRQVMTAIELDTRNQELEYVNTVVATETNLALVGSLFGLLLAFMGFGLWYRRLQVPQDKIIQTKAGSKEV